MGSSADFVDCVCERIVSVGSVRVRKMFGEYMVYVNDKPVLLVCDNTVYAKKLEPLAILMAGAETGAPYQGAKEHYILDIDDCELTLQVVRLLEEFTPLPKPKKKKDNKRL